MSRVELVAFLASSGLLLTVIELVRRRLLTERYSLVWLLTGVALVGLSLWRDGLYLLARLLGIAYPPTALMVAGVGFVLLILLHFSVVVSRLSQANRELAQRYALLAHRVELLEADRREVASDVR